MILARRNLTAQHTDYLTGVRYELEKQEDGGQIAGSMAQNERSLTAEKIAQRTGVSGRTVRRNAQFAQAVDRGPGQEKFNSASIE
jgi:response regulator of citrate/malate metabolism